MVLVSFLKWMVLVLLLQHVIQIEKKTQDGTKRCGLRYLLFSCVKYVLIDYPLKFKKEKVGQTVLDTTKTLFVCARFYCFLFYSRHTKTEKARALLNVLFPSKVNLLTKETFHSWQTLKLKKQSKGHSRWNWILQIMSFFVCSETIKEKQISVSFFSTL